MLYYFDVGNIGTPQIIQEPEDAHVVEGDTAYFNCSIIGTTNRPLWKINGISYYTEDYPPRIDYLRSSKVLEIINVQRRDNGSTYQCITLTQSSRVATLTVYEIVYSSVETGTSLKLLL